MPALKYGAEVLEPITMPLTKLRRSASAPELASLSNMFESTRSSSCPYEVGKMIRLRLHNWTVNAEIIKLFAPFTMAPAMIVRVHAPHMNLTGDFVLKVYDRSYTVECREEHLLPEWNITRDMDFRISQWLDPSLKHACDLVHHSSHQTYSADAELSLEEAIGVYDGGTSSNHAWEEFEIEHAMIKMHNRELEFYRRARQHGIDGQDVPRFLSTVRIPHAYLSRHCPISNESIDGMPGILIQYIPGFPLQALYADPSPPPEQSTWQQIVDQALRLVLNFVQNLGASNSDICPRNTVVHWDPIAGFWKCKFIDFGQCHFQNKTISDADWRIQHGRLDEEGAFAEGMLQLLKHLKGFDYRYERSDFFRQVTEEANRGTDGEDLAVLPAEPIRS